jgi:hypothetical protein
MDTYQTLMEKNLIDIDNKILNNDYNNYQHSDIFFNGFDKFNSQKRIKSCPPKINNSENKNFRR